MIQASDLRLGNWITGELGNEMTVCSIYKNTIECDFNGGWCSVFCPTPIPLSLEILEKCGFGIAYNSYGVQMNGVYTTMKLSNILFHESPQGFLVKTTSKSALTCIQYLHQLQNLYWCLCGEELTYNP